MLLEVKDLQVCYGDLQVLWGVDVAVDEGESVAILGTNGAGKSTILKAISGLARVTAGEMRLDGRRFDETSVRRRVELGVSHVLERRRVFGFSSVEDNLVLGAVPLRARSRAAANLERVYGLFPILRERRRQLAHLLSGGEQQMLAIGRGLMAEPRVLMVDEPFLGLSPAAAAVIARVMEGLRRMRVAVVFVEQNVRAALRMSDRGYIIHAGRIVVEGASDMLLSRPDLETLFLGVARTPGGGVPEGGGGACTGES